MDTSIEIVYRNQKMIEQKEMNISSVNHQDILFIAHERGHCKIFIRRCMYKIRVSEKMKNTQDIIIWSKREKTGE